MTPRDQWLLQKERVLAWMRVGFAVVAVAVILVNPSRAAIFPALSRLALGSFLVYSLAVLYLARRKNADSRKVGLVTTLLDLVWTSLIVFSTGAARTPFFAYYLFPVITAGSRYGIKGGLAVGIVGVVLYGFIRLYFVWDRPLSIDLFIVRSSYLLLLAYIFGFLSEFENKQNQRLLALSKTAGEVATLEERRRIAQELHDGLLQTLATHILRLEICRKQFLDSPEELNRELRKIENDTRSAMREIRQFVANKETRPFPPGMLLEKLKGDLRFLSDGLGLQVILDSEDLTLPESIERDLYFVLREGLTNARRHSHASRLDIKLEQTSAGLEGYIRDDGVGFDSAQTVNRDGLGLSGMKERIKRLGGELSVESSPGKGTRISFVVPLSENAASS
ncbi:MAG: sensor histidine kinase [Candidatus Binatia bacterium]